MKVKVHAYTFTLKIILVAALIFIERNKTQGSTNHEVFRLIKGAAGGTIRLSNAGANYSLNEALRALLRARDLEAPRSRFPF